MGQSWEQFLSNLMWVGTSPICTPPATGHGWAPHSGGQHRGCWVLDAGPWGLSGCKGRVAAIIRADTGTRGKSEQPKAGTGRAYGHMVASWMKEVLAEAGTGKERE